MKHAIKKVHALHLLNGNVPTAECPKVSRGAIHVTMSKSGAVTRYHIEGTSRKVKAVVRRHQSAFSTL